MLKVINAEPQLKTYFKNFFDKSDDVIKSATRHGISEAINKIKADTKANISASWFNSSTSKQYGVGLIEGVWGYMLKGQMSGLVHIMGDTRHNNGTWRLRLFEGGTKMRKTKNGKTYGQIRPTWFFKNAIGDAETTAHDFIDAAISQAINKINNNNT